MFYRLRCFAAIFPFNLRQSRRASPVAEQSSAFHCLIPRKNSFYGIFAAPRGGMGISAPLQCPCPCHCLIPRKNSFYGIFAAPRGGMGISAPLQCPCPCHCLIPRKNSFYGIFAAPRGGKHLDLDCYHYAVLNFRDSRH